MQYFKEISHTSLFDWSALIEMCHLLTIVGGYHHDSIIGIHYQIPRILSSNLTWTINTEGFGGIKFRKIQVILSLFTDER